MTLMRQRWTPGSMNTFPPSWNQLLYAFNQPVRNHKTIYEYDANMDE